jgi:hypothetical protein
MSSARAAPQHWTKIRSTNPLERFNTETGRRTVESLAQILDAEQVRPSSLEHHDIQEVPQLSAA